MADLDRLAGGGAAGGETTAGSEGAAAVGTAAAVAAPSAAQIAIASAGDVRELSDPFIVRFVQATFHLKRYAPFYAAAAAWLLVIVLLQPITSRDPASDETALGGGGSTSTALAEPATSTEDQVPIVLPDGLPIDESGFVPAFESVSSGFASSPSSSESSSVVASPAVSSPVVIGPPRPMRIAESGYASLTGGTPLEQAPPGGGLPVAGANGNVSKSSYIRLAGEVKTLFLQEVADPGANIASDLATIKACPITTAGWTPTRGQALSAAPQSEPPCITGIRSATGSWMFDFADVDAFRVNGWALIPGGTTGFQVVFAPQAVPPAS